MPEIDYVNGGSYFSPRRLGHVNLWVNDLGKSEKFYSDTSGLCVEFTEPGLIASFLGTGHTPHDLGLMEVTRGKDRYGRDGVLQLPGTAGLAPGLNHLAWELENERALVIAFRKLKEGGVPTDLTVDHQVAHSVYIFDPDGNYNEFYCDTIRDWRKVLGGPMDLLTVHWDPMATDGSDEPLYETEPKVRTNAAAPIVPWRITHAVLMTADITGLRDFYTRVTGLAVVNEIEAHGRQIVYLRAGLFEVSHHLVLIQADKASYGRACFELRSEEAFADARTKLIAMGARIVADLDLPWKGSFFLADPDGMLSEYYVRRGGMADIANVPFDQLELAA